MRKDRIIEVEGWLSIVVNTLLFVVKLWAGIVTGSIALIADAWHTLSDSISSFVVIIGARMAQKKADQEHPFGHGRAENIATLTISILLIFIAFGFLKDAALNFYNKDTVVFGKLAIIVTVISIVVKQVLAMFAFFLGKKNSSAILKADAWHHQSDAISSMVILTGIFLAPYFWWCDSALGSIVGVMLIITAITIFKDSVNPLLGQDLEKSLIERVNAIAEEITEVDVKTHHFHIHEYGSHKELTFHIKLPSNFSLQEAHDYATKIEKMVFEKMEIESTIHIEPL